MALLDDTTRRVVWRAVMQRWSALHATLGIITKNDILLAGNAIDQWIEDNTTSFNNAIPQPARGVLTAQQKMDLFVLILRARAGEDVGVS